MSTLWDTRLVLLAVWIVWIVLLLVIGAWIGRRDRQRLEAWYEAAHRKNAHARAARDHPPVSWREPAAKGIDRGSRTPGNGRSAA